MTAAMDRYTPYVLSIVRIVVALIFIEHGTQKMFAFPAAPPGGMPAFASWPGGIAALLEVILTPFFLVGLFTRPVAFILSGEMAIAYWMAHFPRNFYPILNGGDAAILYCFIFLLFAFAGGGAWSLDRLWRGEK